MSGRRSVTVFLQVAGPGLRPGPRRSGQRGLMPDCIVIVPGIRGRQQHPRVRDLADGTAIKAACNVLTVELRARA